MFFLDKAYRSLSVTSFQLLPCLSLSWFSLLVTSFLVFSFLSMPSLTWRHLSNNRIGAKLPAPLVSRKNYIKSPSNWNSSLTTLFSYILRKRARCLHIQERDVHLTLSKGMNFDFLANKLNHELQKVLVPVEQRLTIISNQPASPCTYTSPLYAPQI